MLPFPWQAGRLPGYRSFSLAEGQVVAVRAALRPLERDGYQKGVLHARIGECPADGCSFDAANQVTDFVVRSEVKLPVRIR